MNRVLLPLGLAFIMFVLGLGLQRADFARVLARPRAIVAGLVAQLVLLPVSAAMIAWAAGLGPVPALGLMLLAACPGGVTAGMVTHLARGDTALSVSLTALTSAAAFLTVPLVVWLASAAFVGDALTVRLPVGQTVGTLLLVTLLPLCAGMGLRARLSPLWRKHLSRAATAVFVLIVVHTFVVHRDAIVVHLGALGPATLVLNLVTMATGALIGALVRLDAPGKVALAMECGIQNSALGITLAVSVLGQPALAAPSVIYALVMNLSAFAVIVGRRRALAHT